MSVVLIFTDFANDAIGFQMIAARHGIRIGKMPHEAIKMIKVFGRCSLESFLRRKYDITAYSLEFMLNKMENKGHQFISAVDIPCGEMHYSGDKHAYAFRMAEDYKEGDE